MNELPSGTVTFLFTDIEGSTRLLKSLGPRYEDVLKEHDRCLRAAFAHAGGREIDTQGDAFFAAFARAADALSAAVDVQKGLRDCAWPKGVEVSVRIGIHTAEPKLGEQRYIGIGVHRAARICAAAHGGQVLVSSATRELAEDELPAELELRDLGQHSLKDLDRPEHLFQLHGPGLRSEFPPVRTVAAQTDGATPFAGREGELAQVAHAIFRVRALRRRSLLLAMLAGAIAAAVAVPLFALGQGDPDGQAPPGAKPVSPNSVVAVDPARRAVVAALPVGNTPGPIAVGPSEVWVGNLSDDTMSLIDPESREVVDTIGLPITPSAIAVGDGAVWIAYNGCTATCVERAGASGTRPSDVDRVELAKFDPGRDRVIWTRKLGLGGVGAVDIALAGGSVWVSNETDWTVSRINPSTGKVEATVSEQVDGPKGLAAWEDAVWVLSYPNTWVARIDPRTNRVIATVPIEKPWAFGAGPAGIWVASRFGGVVWRIEPRGTQLAGSVKIPALATGIAVGNERVWVAHRASGSLTSFDPESGRTNTIKIGRPVGDLAVGEGTVWLTVR